MHCYLISFHMHCYLISISHCYPIVRNTCHTQLMNWMISCKSYLATCTHLKRAMNETRPQSLLPRPCEMEVRCRLMWDAGEMHVRCTVPKYPDLHALFVCPSSSNQNTCMAPSTQMSSSDIIRYHQLLMHTDAEMYKYTGIHRMCILKRTDFQCSVLGEPEHVLVIVNAGVTDSWPIWMLVIMCLPAIVSCNNVVQW